MWLIIDIEKLTSPAILIGCGGRGYHTGWSSQNQQLLGDHHPQTAFRPLRDLPDLLAPGGIRLKYD